MENHKEDATEASDVDLEEGLRQRPDGKYPENSHPTQGGNLAEIEPVTPPDEQLLRDVKFLKNMSVPLFAASCTVTVALNTVRLLGNGKPGYIMTSCFFSFMSVSLSLLYTAVAICHQTLFLKYLKWARIGISFTMFLLAFGVIFAVLA